MSKITFVNRSMSDSNSKITLLAWDEDLETDLAVLNFMAWKYGESETDDLIEKLNLVLNGNNGQKILAYKGYQDEMKKFYIDGLLDDGPQNKTPDRIIKLLGRRPNDPMRNQNLETIVKELLKNKEKSY